ncbi:MAG: excinuclease ABC subunit UvrB [Nitrospirae bacterium]|nr:excinuclease ABC subunit UvrB [Nitrospirota bacterium]MBF0541141.1 excinuclease ABC subunit UvrB [Nitrospirota bacterium]
MEFRVQSEFHPTGDQPAAIAALIERIEANHKHNVLLGVTGSGKTFTVANVIEKLQRPALVIAHNKTLAAQIYGELKELFPENAVEYFVSYYDYYQPEAYIPKSDTYIEKDAMVNDDIDRMRHRATMSVLRRRDTIVVASVSCIYGIGSPEDYMGMHLSISTNTSMKRDELIKSLITLQYHRTEIELKRGSFRVRGDIIEIYPSYCLDQALRFEFFGDYIEGIFEFDILTGKKTYSFSVVDIYPNTHWITPGHKLESAIPAIEEEMRERVGEFLRSDKHIEAQRIEQRVRFDLEMLREFGYCHGIENYSRHLSGRLPGEPPYCLIDYFPDDVLIVMDESHVTLPQIRGMYEGDRSRKQNLINYGFRLPSALDNRPLKFMEFNNKITQAIYISATPGDYELGKSELPPVEQIIRPTGLIDPIMIIRPVEGQVDDLLSEIREVIAQKERVLVTTLTKKMAEDLASYYTELGINTRYLHSDIDTLERVIILQDLRKGLFDVLIGVNLLREGLDLPEVSLVAILDADKEGFLRSTRSLIQTSGRAARNINGRVIMYAQRITDSMKRAIDETKRRRKIQLKFNKEHGITPTTIKNSIKNILASIYEADYFSVPIVNVPTIEGSINEADINKLESEMKTAAKALDFEQAAKIRDTIRKIKDSMLTLGIK